MSQPLTFVAILWVAGAALTLRAQERALPPDAKVVRDENGNITQVRLSGQSSAEVAKISPEVIEQLSTISTLESLDFGSSDVSDETITPIMRLRSLKILDLSYSRVTGKSIAMMSKLPTLLSLSLQGCRVTDDDLNALSEMPQLVNLYLRENDITDVGLPKIATLPQLILLDLQNCSITDEGLRSLGHLKHLQHLWLSKTIRCGEDDRSQLSDASVEYLATLKTLIDLRIADSQLTDRGLSRLRDALPKAKVDTTRTGVTYLSNMP